MVVNVQGDEPLIDPLLIDATAKLLLSRPEASMGTAAHPIDTLADYRNPNVVKVSATPMVWPAISAVHRFPFRATTPMKNGGRRQLPSLAIPASPRCAISVSIATKPVFCVSSAVGSRPTEAMEQLEQLRALWHGHRIAVHITPTHRRWRGHA